MNSFTYGTKQHAVHKDSKRIHHRTLDFNSSKANVQKSGIDFPLQKADVYESDIIIKYAKNVVLKQTAQR